jgi:hypothetical protein
MNAKKRRPSGADFNVKNDILHAFLNSEYKHLSPKLEHVALKRGEVIYQADQRIDHVCFPETKASTIHIQLKLASATRLEGQADGVDATAGTVTVLGIVVNVTDMTHFEDHGSQKVNTFKVADVHVGDWLDIHGSESPAGSNELVATQFERLEAQSSVRLAGTVTTAAQPTLRSCRAMSPRRRRPSSATRRIRSRRRRRFSRISSARRPRFAAPGTARPSRRSRLRWAKERTTESRRQYYARESGAGSTVGHAGSEPSEDVFDDPAIKKCRFAIY